MKHAVVLLTLLMLAPIAGLPTRADEVLFISSAGDDGWSGTRPEANAAHNDGPLATLNGARLAVRVRIAKGLTAPIAVQIRGGEYELDKTVVFGPEDSGTEKCPITYCAYPGEKPVFTGARHLADWKPCTTDPAGLPSAAKGKLWTCDIPANLKGSWQITTLYDGLKLMPRSSSGELKLADIQMPEDYNRQPKELIRKLRPDSPPVTFSREIHFQNHDLLAWATPGDIEIFARPTHGWLVNMLPLARIDVAAKTAWFTVDPTYQFSPGNPYQVENAIEYLDKPGEWVFNSAEGRLYLWPDRPMEQCDLRAPFLQEFIRVEGVADKTPARFLNFAGLSFRHGLRDTLREGDMGLQHDWEMYDKGNAILRFRSAEDCAVRGCDFSASSGDGVRLDLHCQRITVADSRFADLGGTGILLSGYGPGTKDESHNNIVTNNLIHHVGEIYWHSPGIFIAQSGRNLITHNTIHDLHYNGMVISGCRPHEFVLAKPLAKRREWVSSIRMSEAQPYIDRLIAKHITDWKNFDINDIEPLLHARENRIENNEIYKVMLTLQDGNAIYFSAMGRDNRVERNYIHDVSSSHGDIRMDDNSSHIVVNENVFARGFCMISLHPDEEIRNNFAIDMKVYFKGLNKNIRSVQNVFYDSDPARTAYRMGIGKKNSTASVFYAELACCSNSLLFAPTVPPGVRLGQDLISADRRGQAEVGMLFADPMFDVEAMKQKIFRFKPDSPCEKLGIKPVDLSTVGSTVQDLQ